MRNLITHPIIKEEVLEALNHAINHEEAHGTIGNINAEILTRLYAVVERDFNPEDYAINLPHLKEDQQ